MDDIRTTIRNIATCLVCNGQLNLCKHSKNYHTRALTVRACELQTFIKATPSAPKARVLLCVDNA